MSAPALALHTASAQGSRSILRFITCGSVDDGKSTLIGRLLFDSRAILVDQRAALARDSDRWGTTGAELDLALLVDGLEAEREQGITIDVAYRFFATPARAFIVADTPGHAQYTRNMATGASNAELAILLIDARKGLLEQTRRHAVIAHLLGIRHVVLAVNKIDLVGFDQTAFETITADFRAFAAGLSFTDITAIPLSARHGDNVSQPSPRTPWYAGPTLLTHLETVDVDSDGAAAAPFRFPVQWVNRPHLDFRGLSGTVASGRIAVGDPVIVTASGRGSRIARIVTFDGDLPAAETGDAVTLVLADDIDAARGDLLADPKARPTLARRFAAKLVWMSGRPAAPGQRYTLKLGTQTLSATLVRLVHRLDVTQLARAPVPRLDLNEIGLAEFETLSPLAFDPFADNRTTGAFILIDPSDNITAGAGMITASLDAAREVHRHPASVDAPARARIKGQIPLCLWLTGLPGSGKSTIANLVERRLHGLGHHTMLLDGDNLRQGLNRDLGFSPEDRAENLRRTGEVAKLMVEAGLIVICAFVSPFRDDRAKLAALFGPGQFFEVHVDADAAICRARDPKGLYAKADAGKITGFTGQDQAYEAPHSPDLRLDTGRLDAETAAARLLTFILDRLHPEQASAFDAAQL